MKKAFDQTVRDIKRGVNKNILKVPRIERKVLDATSNETWGPHGSTLAEIAQASHNHYEYQIIMGIIWKRLNDSGKNWRHVYKGLTVLEYLVANGSERVIGEIRARAYHISSLADFQYIDSKGRDQGLNVRRKSQSLIAVVNDEEKIMEVREKASANKDKYNSSSTGRPDSYGGGYGDHYDDGHGDHNGRGEERYKDEDGYGRDHNGHNGIENYRDDHREQEDHNGYGLENKSADEKVEHSMKEDDRNGVVDNALHDERTAGFKLSDQHIVVPPSYEEAVKNVDKSLSDEGTVKGALALPVQSTPSPPASASAAATPSMPFISEETDAFDDFDPRGPISAAPNVANNVEMDLFGPAAPSAANNDPTVANNVEMDIFGSLSIEDSINSLALVPATSISATSESSVPIKSEMLSVFNQPNTNPFEDAPFHAVLQENSLLSMHNSIPSASFQDSFVSNSRPSAFETVESGPGHEFGEIFHSIPSNSSIPNGQPTSTALEFRILETPDAHASFDILEGILPTNGPSSTFLQQSAVVVSSTRTPIDHSGFLAQPVVTMSVASQEIVPNHYGLPEKLPQATSQHNFNVSGLTTEPSAAFTPQASVSVAPTRSVTDNPDFIAQLPVSIPVASLETQPEKLTEVTSQSNLNSLGLTNEQTSAFPPQADLSVTPITTQADHLDIPPLPTVLQPVSSEDSLLQSYSEPSVPTQLASQNTNGVPSTLLVPAALITSPVMTQVGHPDFHAQPTTSMPVVPQVPVPNYHGQEETPLQGGPVHQLNSSASSSKVIPPSGVAGSGLSSQASPNFGSLFTSEAAPSNTGPTTKPSQQSDKFETKSPFWADTISRGLVNLDISGAKVNPLAGIGVDFDSLKRKEIREKKSSVTPVSTVTMGKAMGSGSGMGRSAATGLAPPPNHLMGPGMGWGGGAGMGMGGFGGMNMGMGVNMGVNQGLAMHPNAAALSNPAGIGMAGTGYNPMSMNRYGSQPYGGPYR